MLRETKNEKLRTGGVGSEIRDVSHPNPSLCISWSIVEISYTNVAANQTGKLVLLLPLLLPWKRALPRKLLVTKHYNTEPGTNRYSGLLSVFCQQLLRKRKSVFHYHLLSIIWLSLISRILYASRIGGRPK